MARFFSFLIAAVILLAVAAYVLLPQFLDKDSVVGIAADAVKKETGAILAVDGDLKLSLFPVVGVAFTQASVTMPESSQPDLEVASAQVGVRVLPLLTGAVEVDSITLDGLIARIPPAEEEKKAETLGMSDAELDAYYARREQARKAAGDSAGAEAALAVPLALSVSSLKVTDAQIISLDDTGGATTTLEILALDARDLNLDGAPIPLALRLLVPGQEPINVNVAGDLELAQSEDSVRFKALAVDIRGATPEPLALTVSGTVDLARQIADTQLQITMGELRGDGQLRYANFESPQIDTDLSLNVFDPLLFALAGPQAAEAGNNEQAASGDEPLPLEAIRGIDTHALLKIDEARFSGHSITGLRTELRAKDGVVSLRELSGTVYGGQINASATLNGRHNTATLETRGGVNGLDVAAATAASESAGTVSGLASLNWQLKSAGKTPNELTNALQGPVDLSTEDITLKGTSVEKMLCQAVALTNKESLSATFSPDTRFSEVSAKVQLGDGKATLKPLQANLAHVSLAGNGALDIMEQDFKATFKAQLSPEMEELDHACRVSKRLAAIDFPVDCKGNLAGDPADWCGVDTEEIVKDLAVNEGRRTIEKKAGKLFDKLFGGKKD